MSLSKTKVLSTGNQYETGSSSDAGNVSGTAVSMT